MAEWLTESPWPILALAFGGVALLVLAAFLMERASQRRYQRILELGEPAEATVLAARDSGWRTNGRPHIRFTLEVRRSGHPPYQTTLNLQIHRPWSAIPYPPGSLVQVRVDRDRPERVAIVDARPVLGGAMIDVGALPLGGVRVSNTQVYATDAGDGSPSSSLAELKRMLDQGLISPEEHEAKKAEILGRL